MTGVAVGLGIEDRSTSSTSRRKSSKIGIYYCHPFIIADGP